MCLTLLVRVSPAVADALAPAVATHSSALVTFDPPRSGHAPRWPWARVRPPEAIAPCLCALLSDEADWCAPTWAMRPEACEPLAATLEGLALALPGAEVEVLWAGDRAEKECTVTPAELAALARTSALGTKTRYRVAGAPAS